MEEQPSFIYSSNRFLLSTLHCAPDAGLCTRYNSSEQNKKILAIMELTFILGVERKRGGAETYNRQSIYVIATSAEGPLHEILTSFNYFIFIV